MKLRARRRARAATTSLAVERRGRDRRVLGRAVRAGRASTAAPDYVVRHEPGRRLQLPRAGAPRRRAARVPLDQPRLPLAALDRAAYARRTTRFELEPDQELAGTRPSGRLRGASRSTARARSTARRSSRPSCSSPSTATTFGLRDGDRPLRRDRRPVADGEGRPGRVHATGCWRTTSGGRCATSATAAAASRCATCCTWPTCVDLVEDQLAAPRALGRRRPSTSAAGARCSLSLLETTEICRELTGHDVPVGSADRGPPRRRAHLPLGLRAARGAHGLAAAARRPREVLEDIFDVGRRRTSAPCARRYG